MSKRNSPKRCMRTDTLVVTLLTFLAGFMLGKITSPPSLPSSNDNNYNYNNDASNSVKCQQLLPDAPHSNNNANNVQSQKNNHVTPDIIVQPSFMTNTITVPEATGTTSSGSGSGSPRVPRVEDAHKPIAPATSTAKNNDATLDTQIDTAATTDTHTATATATTTATATATDTATTTTTTTRTMEEEEEKPLCIIHMGPHKTGTTSIQKFIIAHKQVLELDGWDSTMTLGSRNNDGGLDMIRNCIKNEDHCRRGKKTQKAWSWRVNNTLTLGKQRGMNLLISDEEFAHFDFDGNDDWEDFLKFLQLHYRVKVILVYRRYWEWLPSYYNQHYKFDGPYGMRMYKWPPKGKAIISLAEYWNQRLNGTVDDRWAKNNQYDHITDLPSHDGLEIKNKLERQNITVKVLNMHGTKLLESFFCEAIPKANQTCQAAKNPEKEKKKKNLAKVYYDWDLIGLAAKEEGLLQEDLARNFLKYAIKEYLQNTGQVAPLADHLPMICLQKDKEAILRRVSYIAEKELMPSMLPTFNQSFDEAMANNKFCNVDTQAIMKNETWRSLLSALRKQ